MSDRHHSDATVTVAEPGSPVPAAELATRARDAAELLEQVAADHRLLAALDEELRRRLVTAAGQVSRPDRYARKALSKSILRSRVAAKRAADSAVLEATGIRTLRRDPVFRTPLPMPSQALDAPVRDDGEDGATDVGGWGAGEAARDQAAGDEVARDQAPAAGRVIDPRTCYVCKTAYHQLHDFYDQLCPPCAALNWEKRHQTADLRGRFALVTGGRVKIGYHAAVKLLRAGATVLVTTRFPRDATTRFLAEPDAADWAERLSVYGLDLRHTPSVEALCQEWLRTLPRLDMVLNNACQTVRRPAGWYDHLISRELSPWRELPATERRLLEPWRAAGGDATAVADPSGLAPAGGGQAGLWQSAVLSQLPLLAEDLERGNHLFPSGRLDADLQQVDLREFNSWRMTLADVPTAELLEVHLVNAVAPFVLNARLKALLAKVPTRDAHVVNVSAMEGQFYRRWKTDRHPHTNMAKAALNMLTRTSAADYIKDGIHMNAVDTGWVTDEDPAVIAERKKMVHRFSPPLDIVDGAARIVDPLFDGIRTGRHVWGVFLKDYRPAPW